MRIRLAQGVTVATLLLLTACSGMDLRKGPAEDGAHAQATPSVVESRTPTVSPSSTVDISHNQPGTAGVPITMNPIPFGPERRAQMAYYALRHYKINSEVLKPQAIVLHFTEGNTWQSAFATFARNTPARGEMPGTCAHYTVDKDGTILEFVPPDVMCRHAVGLNHVALGIEIVQMSSGNGSRWAEQQILNRPAQIQSVLALVRQLQATYGIPTENIVGHAQANDHPLFLDVKGWRNDHTDWGAQSMAEFKARL